ncbi:glycosyltransferase [Cysteiniphilum sp. JM-1]|uniref:glycosyltransferase n=1 Tax=Cysteiniphilum sp. JM-1 TaxID=2610891 RepID=UPI00168D1752|nr:glycosyltransferase [Cysteiniphilum sp. JM-1]
MQKNTISYKPRVLAIVPSLIPSVTIGVVRPMLALQAEGQLSFSVTLSCFFKEKYLENVDCIIFCRNSLPSEEWIIKKIIESEIPYIYEIDDNFFEIPVDTLIGRMHRHPSNLVTLKNFAKHAALIRTYSNILANSLRLINQNVEVNKVYFDVSLIEKLKKDNQSGCVKIVYATSRIEDDQQLIILEALSRIAINYKKKVQIYFWGGDEKALPKHLKNVHYLKPIRNYAEFIKKFYEQGFDIGLAPIFQGKFFNSKTNNKYREYGGCEIAGVYSRQPLYESCITNEENGILVDNSVESWFNGIDRLINDQTLRQKIIANAKSDIEKNYSFDIFCDGWVKNILEVTNSVIRTSSVGGNDLCNKGGYTQAVLLYTQDIVGSFKLSRLKKLLMKKAYPRGALCEIVDEVVIQEPDELLDLEFIYLQRKNFFILCNDEKVIKAIDQLSSKFRLNSILLTEIEETDFIRKMHVVKISPEQSVDLYETFYENIYIKIEEMMRQVFLFQTVEHHSRLFTSTLSWVKRSRFGKLIRIILDLCVRLRRKTEILIELYLINHRK